MPKVRFSIYNVRIYEVKTEECPIFAPEKQFGYPTTGSSIYNDQQGAMFEQTTNVFTEVTQGNCSPSTHKFLKGGQLVIVDARGTKYTSTGTLLRF